MVLIFVMMFLLVLSFLGCDSYFFSQAASQLSMTTEKDVSSFLNLKLLQFQSSQSMYRTFGFRCQFFCEGVPHEFMQVFLFAPQPWTCPFASEILVSMDQL
eukprot:TRINITY_DN3739_c0_g1_i1.p1 TRINITY_DN3739_c0_g1~~TRINITY_DN3739_c0_g1_i1.p1  ORF type:complete len:101 (+),score=21.87 TRINITY_DN3739_c0_g1_i1:654-956(+)